MEANRKRLIELRTKLNFYKKLDKKIESVLNAELELTDWQEEVYFKLTSIEKELFDLKIEMDLSDEEYEQDEVGYERFSFNPSEELIEFAKEFSENFKELGLGRYVSDNGKYIIRYQEDYYLGTTTPLSVRITTNDDSEDKDSILFVLTKKMIEVGYSNDFVFFLIIWGAIEKEINNTIFADEIAIDYYISTLRSKENLLKDFTKMCELSNHTKINITRLHNLKRLLEINIGEPVSK